jgi:hypothetical protein
MVYDPPCQAFLQLIYCINAFVWVGAFGKTAQENYHSHYRQVRRAIKAIAHVSRLVLTLGVAELLNFATSMPC